MYTYKLEKHTHVHHDSWMKLSVPLHTLLEQFCAQTWRQKNANSLQTTFLHYLVVNSTSNFPLTVLKHEWPRHKSFDFVHLPFWFSFLFLPLHYMHNSRTKGYTCIQMVCTPCDFFTIGDATLWGNIAACKLRLMSYGHKHSLQSSPNMPFHGFFRCTWELDVHVSAPEVYWLCLNRLPFLFSLG